MSTDSSFSHSIICNNDSSGLSVCGLPSASLSHSLGIFIAVKRGGIHHSSEEESLHLIFKNQPCYSVSVQLLISRLFVTLWFARLPSLAFFSPFLLTLSGRKDSLFEYIRSVTNLEESEMETDALSDLNLPCLIMQSTFFRSYLVSQRHTPAMLSGILMGFLPLVHVKK